MGIIDAVRQAVAGDPQPMIFKNPDGSFMSPDQIFADIVSNSRINEPGQELLRHNFDPPISAEAREAMRVTGFDGLAYMRTELGRWIRNTYGLWEVENPHTKAPDDDSHVRDGVDHHPLHPKAVTETVITRLVEHYKPTRH